MKTSKPSSFNRFAVAIVGSLLIAAGTTACQPREGPLERAGKQVDKAVEKTGDKIEEAGKRIEGAAKK